MRREVVSTRIEPELKQKIEREAASKERDPGWLIRRLIELGWETYKAPKSRRAA